MCGKQRRFYTRRDILRNASLGFGSLAFSTLAAQQKPHFPAKVKNVIFCYMSGGVSHIDSFDPKPRLTQEAGKPMPVPIDRTMFNQNGNIMPSPWAFKNYGQCGMPISDLFPHMGGVADDLCLIRSMTVKFMEHAQANNYFHSGNPLTVYPTLGAWATYGLGTENQDLPGFVVLTSGGNNPDAGKSLWGSAFLPSVFQGVHCRSHGDPVLFLSDPEGMTRGVRRKTLDALKDLNGMQAKQAGDPETEARMEQYELAYRMQISVPKVMDISREPEAVHSAYGTEPGKTSLANNCLLARRLVENGVRFVQIYDWGWDHHGTSKRDDIQYALQPHIKTADQAVTALLKDLKQRGLLEQTLVVWGGEFGRTPMRENRGGAEGAFIGRDHHPYAYTMWMAGGGMKKGLNYGETDDIGYYVTKDKMTPRDLQATILHQIGLDPHKLHYPYLGLNQRLIGPTDEGRVMRDLLV